MAGVNDPHVYLLSDSERQLVQGGPALIAPDGVRYDIPVRVYEALRKVEEVLRSGKAVQIKALDPELGIGPAADVIDMHPDTLRSNVERGEIPSRQAGTIHWLKLTDVLEFDRRRRQQQTAAMQDLADEEPWDESPNGTGG